MIAARPAVAPAARRVLPRALLLLTVLLLGLHVATPAHAAAVCPSMWESDAPENRYYALLFVKPALPAAQREQLVDQVSLTFDDLTRSVARRAGLPRLEVRFVLCDYQVMSGDFDLREMQEYLGYRVIAVFWSGREGTRPGLVHLAIPVYLRMPGATRREAEVVTPIDDRGLSAVESWIEVLVDEGTIGPFVSMGLATAHQKRGEIAAAWVAYCDSRNGLAALEGRTLRPAQEALRRDIAAGLGSIMDELKANARRAGGAPLPDCQLAPGRP